MVEEQHVSPDDKFNKFKEKLKAQEEKKSADAAILLATREKLERDFLEDKIYVTFKSSLETNRTILARRPTQREFLDILSLSVQAAKFEGKGDIESLENLHKVFSSLNTIASKLCVDASLDDDFWQNKVSFNTLQSFIGELINSTQKASAGNIPESDMKSFR